MATYHRYERFPQRFANGALHRFAIKTRAPSIAIFRRRTPELHELIAATGFAGGPARTGTGAAWPSVPRARLSSRAEFRFAQLRKRRERSSAIRSRRRRQSPCAPIAAEREAANQCWDLAGDLKAAAVRVGRAVEGGPLPRPDARCRRYITQP